MDRTYINTKTIRYCPHCGNRAPQEVIYKYDFYEDILDEETVIDILHHLRLIARCETCDDILLYYVPSYHIDELDKGILSPFAFAVLQWPILAKFDTKAVPEKILKIYDEAAKIKLLAPNAFVVLIGRALEIICIYQGIDGKIPLQKKLKKLTELGKLPSLLSEVTNIIRLIRNAGAHAIGPNISNQHASAIDDFFRVIIEYLYIAPYKLKQFKDEAEKFK